jgi:hypothetical protein
MALIISVISAYTFDSFPDLAFLINLSCLTVILTIAYQLPFFYSLLMTFILYLLGGIFEYGIPAIATNLLKLNLPMGSIGLQIIYGIIGMLYLLIAFLLERKKLGFMFMARHFTMRNSVKGYNFALSAVLIASILSQQIISLVALSNSYNITNSLLLIVITILFLLGIWISYKQNKKQLKEKHERLQKK